MYIEGINEEIGAANGEQPDEPSINLMDKGFKVRQGNATVAEDYGDEEGPDGV